jgi:acetyl esterase/lipase
MTPSARLWGGRRIVIGTPDLAFFAEQYAPAERRRDRDVSPLYAQLTGLPPALCSCGTLDPLLELFMAARWQAAGNASELALYPGAPHEFLNLRDRIGAEGEARGRMLAFFDRVPRVDAQLTAISIRQVPVRCITWRSARVNATRATSSQTGQRSTLAAPR